MIATHSSSNFLDLLKCFFFSEEILCLFIYTLKNKVATTALAPNNHSFKS